MNIINKFFLRSFLLLDLYTRNGYDGFIYNIIKKFSQTKIKTIIEFGAHGHNHGLMGLATSLIYKSKYLVIDSEKEHTDDLKYLKKKYKLDNMIIKNKKISIKGNNSICNIVKNENSNFKSLDLLILDVDGHEIEILNNLFYLNPKMIFVECNYKKGNKIDISKLDYFLDKYDYNIHFVLDVNVFLVKKNILSINKINFKNNQLNTDNSSLIKNIFYKINSKFFYGLYLRIFKTKILNINELISKVNPYEKK
tara:strand:+ start:910 stop:1665 length:756 start_codon:yes stop_codon:yes gene_type:complete